MTAATQTIGDWLPSPGPGRRSRERSGSRDTIAPLLALLDLDECVALARLDPTGMSLSVSGIHMSCFCFGVVM